MIHALIRSASTRYSLIGHAPVRAFARSVIACLALCLVPATAMAASNGLYRSPVLNHPIQETIDGTSLNVVTGTLDDSGPIDGDWDLNLFATGLGGAFTFWGVDTHNAQFLVNLDGEVLALQPGDAVTGNHYFSQTDNGVPPADAWLAGADAYAGFRFECDGRLAHPVEGGTGFCYGYVHLVTTAGNGFPATIVEYAFDGDGYPIHIDPSPGFPSYEGFDALTVPALPAGWVSTAGGAGSDWVTVDDMADTAPNALYVNGADDIADITLDLPAYTPADQGDIEVLRFRHRFDLEAGFDGGVLEISTDGGATFQDIITAGGRFVHGGYTDTIATFGGNPIAGREAWSGDSGGFITTEVLFPPAAGGLPSILRFRMTSDESGVMGGWWIDSIAVNVAEPDVYTTQDRYFTAVASGASVDLAVTIANRGAVFAGWNLFSASYDHCATTTTVPFIAAIVPDSGLLGEGSEVEVTVTLDATALNAGTHVAQLCLASSDPRDPLIALPLRLRVVDGAGGNGVLQSAVLLHPVMETQAGTSLNLVRHVLDDEGPINGDWDLNFWNRDGLSFWGVDTYQTAFVIDGNDQVPVLQTGDSIGPASTFSASGDEVYASPEWLAGSDGYVGFRFDCDDRLLFPVPSGTCYGYVHLSSTGPDGFPATILDYAFGGDGHPVTIAVPGFPSLEDFDRVAVPALPAGWITTATGAGVGWTTTGDFTNTAPNAAHAPAFGDIADMLLDTPAFTPTAGQTIGFLHRYDLEDEYDGAVLEISIDGGTTFEDIISAGGSFLAGRPYDITIESDFESPIAGREAWTGDSNGYVFTEVALPPAAIGTATILRFRTADDESEGGGADRGWWIDTVQLLGAPVFEADILVAPTTVAGSAQEGTTTSVDFDIGNTGTGALDWSVAASGDDCASTGNVAWISAIVPASGTIGAGDPDGTVTATLDATALAAGNYAAQLCVTSNDPDEATVIVSVAFTVTATPVADITVAPADIAATVAAGDSTERTLTIGNTGTATLDWNVATSTDNCASTTGVAWLSATPASGAIGTGDADVEVDVALDAATLDAGDYDAQLCVTSNDPDDATVIIPVELTVTVPAGECVFADGFDGGSGTCQ